jgi:uncharacterized damage-inducible protein DinB
MSTLSATSTEKDPRFPIGKHNRAAANLTDHRSSIATLAALAENLRSAVEGLSDTQLNTPYREGGWSVRQLVHHVADSHMNAYLRIRLALTEDWPAITAYNEKAWAELTDARTAPVQVSLDLIQALHDRWTLLLRSLSEEQWQRGYIHPVNGRQTIAEAVALYDWHSRHHVAHIEELRKSRSW